MSSFGEFDQPLGQPKPSKPRRKLPVSTLFGSIVVLCAGITGYFWHDISNKNPTQTAQIDAVIDQKITTKLMRQSLETDSQTVGAIIPGDKKVNDFEEIQPDGEIREPIVMPRKSASEVRQKQILAHLPDSQLAERGATGIIPKKSSDGLRPMDVYSRQPITEGNFGVARVVIIVAGMGISQTSTQQAIQKLPGEVTLAFAPYGNSLARWMQTARKSGHELLLQVPMEPYGYPQNNPGVHTLTTKADVEENLTNLHWAMSRMTNYVGIMNYLGGKFITDPTVLKPVFDEISQRGLLFLEDGTVKNSAGKLAAGKSLMPYAKAHIQIDNVRSRSAIAEQLNKLADQAKRTGLAIGVANAFPESIAMIAEFAKQAKQKKLEISPVSSVVIDPLNPK